MSNTSWSNTSVPHTLQVQNLSVAVGHGLHRKTILQDLNFTVRAGEKLAVLGANGAGKSTLLKCLSGEFSQYQGQIRFAGQELNSWRQFLPSADGKV